MEAKAEIKRLRGEKSRRDEWFGQLVRWGQSVVVRNFLRDYANQCFQMQGMYDGAMSEECKALCYTDYEFTTGLLEIIGAAKAGDE